MLSWQILCGTSVSHINYSFDGIPSYKHFGRAKNAIQVVLPSVHSSAPLMSVQHFLQVEPTDTQTWTHKQVDSGTDLCDLCRGRHPWSQDGRAVICSTKLSISLVANLNIFISVSVCSMKALFMCRFKYKWVFNETFSGTQEIMHLLYFPPAAVF